MTTPTAFDSTDLPGYDDWLTQGIPCTPNRSIEEEQENNNTENDWAFENHRVSTRPAKNFVAKVF